MPSFSLLWFALWANRAEVRREEGLTAEIVCVYKDSYNVLDSHRNGVIY